MRKNIYVITTAAMMTGILLTACAPKTAVTETTGAVVESTADETAPEESLSEKTTEGAGGESAPSENVYDVYLEQAHEAVKQVYGDNYIPNMPYDAIALKEVFGVDDSLYDAFIAEGPMISVNIETFIGVKAKEGKAADVAAALEGYRKNQLDAAVQYPMNMVKAEASQVVTHGDYVFFVMLGAADMETEEKGEKEALESAKQNNQIGIDAISSIFAN